MQTMLLEINFKIIEYGSPEYKKAVALRERILRKPIGLSFSDLNYSQKKSIFKLLALMV
jgi:hypothetical protein